MKYIFKQQTGSVYWLENGILFFAPMLHDNSFDTEEGGEVDLSLKDEVIELSPQKTLGDIWAEARIALQTHYLPVHPVHYGETKEE